MRIPRPNFIIRSGKAGPAAEPPAGTPGLVGNRFQTPAWQRSLSLPANVRYTRTPDTELRRSDEGDAAEAPVAIAEADSAGMADPQGVEAPPHVPEAEPAAALQAEPPPPGRTSEDAGPPGKSAGVSPWSNLPDGVFWESLDWHGLLPEPGRPPARTPADAAIVAHFRAYSWEPASKPTPPKAGVAAPARAEDEAPVEWGAIAADGDDEMVESHAEEPSDWDGTGEAQEDGSFAEEEDEPAVAPICPPSAPPSPALAVQDYGRSLIPALSPSPPPASRGDRTIPTQDNDPVSKPAPPRPAQPARALSIHPYDRSPAPARSGPPPRPAVFDGRYELPPISLLAEPKKQTGAVVSTEALEQNARLLESVLEDFGIRGEIIHVRPGPVVTLYELEPAPGIKSSRVIGLADDIARSMSALSARVAVVPGRNVIGIELPNAKREMVYFRELIASADFEKSKFKLALALGKTIGGEPVIAQLEKMPHLLVAGTTGSGKSVAINTMILSLLYRLKPQECRLIMVDPKMLELSIYDGIPHLLAPVVTDPKKAVLALKWAVREMEERYKKMSKLGVRNIDGYNARAAAATEKGESVIRTVQTGFDKETGEALYEQEEMDLSSMPYIVVIVDEMADLMMVAGKDIEGAIQRLAQMARAAGIHLIMATQRPSVDVITGTIKANFPTRISFQVTSKIDSRTILSEQGAEQLLGQGDMLHMAGGGRITRVHGPFVSDDEVEKVVAHLKAQGRPDYLDTITADEEGEAEEAESDAAVFDKGSFGGEDGADLYDQAVKVVMRDKKCSTSYIQRRLQIGYNRAASLVERMEKEGLVGPANHAGKREILSYSRDRIIHVGGPQDMEDDDA